MKQKKVCLINDIAGYGRVASTAMLPVLAVHGLMSSILPTALVSNVLDYGQFHIEDTKEVMAKTIEIWKSLALEPDAIATGFVNSEGEFALIEQFLKDHQNSLILVDPTMGDDGALYPGLDPKIPAHMASLIRLADVITPNMTEAALLLNEQPLKQINEERIIEWLNSLHEQGARSVVITSVFLPQDPKGYIFGYDAQTKTTFKLPFTPIDARFPGTGDVFAAVLLARLLKGESLKEACDTAAMFIYDCIRESIEVEYDHIEGMLVEQNLYRLMGETYVKS